MLFPAGHGTAADEREGTGEAELTISVEPPTQTATEAIGFQVREGGGGGKRAVGSKNTATRGVASCGDRKRGSSRAGELMVRRCR